MQIREAKESDISAILKVLRASLGETSSKKTEEVWRYKHIDNPFGQSLVLIAEENEEIIGVRAFMRWKWQKGEQVYSAFRAVDTATHPNHQGKGVFRRLTIKALELGKKSGDHFVFNTPNPQSKPGYLKMGWKEVDKLKIELRSVNLLRRKKRKLNYAVLGEAISSEKLVTCFFEKEKKSKRFFTPKDIQFLIWRYVNNPLQDYSVIFDQEYFIAGYLKKRGGIKEFRISELIILNLENKKVKKIILTMAKASGATVLSISPNKGVKFKTSLTKKLGPVLTCKNINLRNKEEKELLDLSFWSYSLGDLELF